MYDLVIVTHLPAFYKVNLYNEISKNIKIYVVFLGETTSEIRSDDFSSLNKIRFEYTVLCSGDFQTRNKVKSLIELNKLLKNISYKKVIVGGWELVESWFLIFTNKKTKNCLALESTINESITTGYKGVLKKIFLSRISTVFASGSLHRALLNRLCFKNIIKVTKGVGLMNKPIFSKEKRVYEKKFIFIGRISKEKNLELLINIFNDLPEYKLTIVGVGPESERLKKMASSTINFIGHMENKNIKNILLNNNILILPSISETWGLVVEEALYFGLPVIVSNNCGASELVEDGKNGFAVDVNNPEYIKKLILGIDDDYYKKLCLGVDEFSIEQKDIRQVDVYLN